MNVRTIRQVAVAGVVASALAACADAPTMAPNVRASAPMLGIVPGAPGPNTRQADVEYFEVCKDYKTAAGAPTTGPDVTIRVQAPGYDQNITLAGGQCTDVWVSGSPELVTVTETVPSGYAASWTKDVLQDNLTIASSSGSGNSASGYVSGPNASTQNSLGVLVVFTNTVVPPPPAGCTYTQGYWKTHSSYGPAPYDDGWVNVGGADAAFFSSGQTWLQVFNTPPAGNAYYNLAHQYMAAKLNSLNGASVPSNVASAITAAEALFNAYTPAQAAALAKNSATRAQFIALAGTLGSYNEGLIGPGHCGS